MNFVKLILAATFLGLLMGCGGAGSGGNSSSSGSSSSGSGSGGGSTSSSSSSSGGGSSSGPATGTLSCMEANTVQGFASLDGGTTGGEGGNYLIATTGADIVDALATKKDNPNPLTIYVNGTITEANSGGTNQFDVKDMDNVSIIGVGSAGIFDGIGINIVRANNVIVRNVTVRYVTTGQKDGISIQDSGSNIWIDHNELYNEFDPDGTGNAADKDYYDELISGKNDIDNITLSYNYLHDSWKTSLWGSSDSDNFNRRISFIANRWEDANSRLPLFRFGEGHVLNNYYKNVDATGINSRMGAEIRVEGNHFEDVRNVLISMDSDEIGYWNPSDNIVDNAVWTTMPSGNCTSTPCSWGGTEGTTQNGGEFISTSSYVPPYTYTIINGADVKEHVITNAGVNKVSRECLGVPDEIVEGEPGEGSSSGGSSSSSSSSSSSTSGGPVAGGWVAGSMEIGPSPYSDTTGSVTSSSETAVTFTINRGKFESEKESFFFISQDVTGNFEFTANLSNMNAPTRAGSNQGHVGVMMCIDCVNGAATAAATAKIGVFDNSGPFIIHTHRLSDGGSRVNNETSVAVTPGAMLYLRIARAGDSYTVSYSTDGGTSYTPADTQTFAGIVPETVQVGIYAAQGEDEGNGFTFENISLVQ